MSTEEALAAMNAALGDAIAPDTTAGDTNHEAAGDDEAQHGTEHEAAGDEEAAAGDDAAAEEGEALEGAAAEKAIAEGRERNADGTFKKAEAKPDGEKPAAEAKLDKDGKPIPEKKAADPLNDPIPKDLKQETQERMRSLIKTAKESAEKATQFETDFNYLTQGIAATGATPEQYGETLSWLAMFNSNDPAQQAKALELVETVADRLSTLLGKERTVGDPLGQHEDLKAAVKSGQTTLAFAKEIARTRNATNFRSELTTQATTQATQQEANARELSNARKALTDLEGTLQSTDPDYAAKRAILVPVLKTIFPTIPPAQWKAKFEEAYRTVKVPRAAARSASAGTGGAPANQPMRAGKNPAGGQARAPASMGEAINAALAGMK